VAKGELEVVIVDDGSTDATPAVLADLASRTPLRVSVLRNETSQGPAAGRNTAWNAATAPVIAFTDDDCVPAPGWLAAGLRAMNDQQRVVVGSVRPDPAQAHRHDVLAHTLLVGPAQLGWCATANIFYRREDLVRAEGFYAGFPSAACEDTDLGLRVEAQGATLVFEPLARVLHDVTRGSLRVKIRKQLLWEWIPLLMARHPDSRRRLMYAPGVWKQSHIELVALLAGVMLGARDRRALALALPWLHEKACHREEMGGSAVTEIPVLLVLDLAELVAVVKGSWRHRIVVL
jgi:glycosyltransferase involved in cell wall biosynthesis